FEFSFRYALVCSLMGVTLMANEKDLEMRQVYNQIVRNLIKNWESPVVYLRDRGFLPSDYEDTSKIKPNLKALMQRMQRKNRGKAKFLEYRKISVRPREKELQNSSRTDRDLKSYMLPNLDKLLSENGKGAQPKPKLDEQGAQLLDMKMRLEQMQQKHQEGQRQKIKAESQHKEPVFIGRSYDDMLQRMIDRTNPRFKQIDRSRSYSQKYESRIVTNQGAQPNRNPDANQSGKDDLLLSPDSIKLSIYSSHYPLIKQISKPAIYQSQYSRDNYEESNGSGKAADIEPGLKAPSFLNWDMKNGRLDHYSPIEKDAYLNQLVRVFGKKLVLKESHHKEEISSS
ncbi:hypothetical protein KR009_007055, partial [Drosophila setifemur]